jgi:hypothetical protein
MGWPLLFFACVAMRSGACLRGATFSSAALLASSSSLSPLPLSSEELSA